MNIASPGPISDADAAFLCRLFRMATAAVPASELGDDLDLVPDLQGAGYLVVFDEDEEHPEPRVMIHPLIAFRAGFEAASPGHPWEPVRPLPETAAELAREAKRKRVRVINETDLKARSERRGEKAAGSAVDKAVADAMPPIDDGGFRRPTQLLGIGMVWQGPDVGNRVRDDRACQVCGELADVGRGVACSMCDRLHGEKPKAVRAAKRKTA